MLKLPKQSMTLASQVAEILQDAILKGEIKPGERLYQDTVAKQLGVSRIPVRLAFEMLHNRGLVTLTPHKGAVVTELSIEDLKDIFKVRAFIEELAIERSLPKLTEADLEQCEQVIKKMRAIHDPDEWLELNNRFHAILNSKFSCHNLNEMISMLRTSAQRYIRIALLVIDRFNDYNSEHEAILQACRRRDVELAKNLVKNHLNNTVLAIEEYLKQKISGKQKEG